MAAFVYHINSLDRSQSPSSQQRPAHIPSRNLSQNENEQLLNLLGNSCVSLATAVAQILHVSNNTWEKKACGVLCFIKDYSQRIYCLRLYDFRSGQSIYEEIITSSIRLKKLQDFFYTFNGMNCTVGINFPDQIEAETFCKHFHTKQESRQNKKKENEPPNIQGTSVMKEIQITTVNKESKSKTSSKNKKKDRPFISEPDPSSFACVMSVTPERCFLSDESQRQLFEAVLGGMHISAEEKLYVQKLVQDTNGSLGTLFPDSENSSHPPEQLTSRRNNRQRAPHQDISLPTSIYQQTRRNHPQHQNKFNRPTLPLPASPSMPTNSQNAGIRRPPPPPPLKPTNVQSSSVPSPLSLSPNSVNVQNPGVHSPPPTSPKPTNLQNTGIRSPPPKMTNIQNSDVLSPPPISPKPANLQNANVRLPPPPLPKPTNLKNSGIHPSPPPPPPPMPADFQNTNICTPPPAAPPMPADFQNTNICTPPPAAPPMPIDLQNNGVYSPPNCLPEQMTNEPPTSTSDPQRGGLLDDICKFDKDNLKPASERLLAQKQSYAETIRELLRRRRSGIMKNHSTDDESDSNDDEWD